MSWPTEIWDPRNPNANDAGMAPYAPPADPNWLVGKESGLPDDWQDYDMKVNVWDALENPLYKVAAEAKGIDWDDFKSRVNTQIGPEDEYKFAESKMVTVKGSMKDAAGRPLQQQGYTYNKTTYEEDLKEWNNDEDAGRDEKPDPKDYPGMGPQINEFGFSGKTGSLYGDMKSMSGWLGEIDEKSSSKGSYETIAKGPQGSDYGIEGDIWEYYGLDKAPEGPTQLDESYFNYKDTLYRPDGEADRYSQPDTVHGGMSDTWIDAAVELGMDSSITIDQALENAGA